MSTNENTTTKLDPEKVTLSEEVQVSLRIRIGKNVARPFQAVGRFVARITRRSVKAVKVTLAKITRPITERVFAFHAHRMVKDGLYAKFVYLNRYALRGVKISLAMYGILLAGLTVIYAGVLLAMGGGLTALGALLVVLAQEALIGFFQVAVLSYAMSYALGLFFAMSDLVTPAELAWS